MIEAWKRESNEWNRHKIRIVQKKTSNQNCARKETEASIYSEIVNKLN